jgi:hypothetical protein
MLSRQLNRYDLRMTEGRLAFFTVVAARCDDLSRRYDYSAHGNVSTACCLSSGG